MSPLAYPWRDARFAPDRWAAGVDLFGVSSIVTLVRTTDPLLGPYLAREMGTLPADEAQYGVNAHAPEGTLLEKLFAEAEAAGVSWVRVDFGWADGWVQP